MEVVLDKLKLEEQGDNQLYIFTKHGKCQPQKNITDFDYTISVV